MIRVTSVIVILLGMLASSGTPPRTYDVVIYGGTAAAVIAGVQARKMGKTVVIVSPNKHLGGLSSSGLGHTDTGNKAVIGGLALDFYRRLYRYYEQTDAWTWQKREEYTSDDAGSRAMDRERQAAWTFEPHVAESLFEDYVREFNIAVERDEWLDRSSGVSKSGSHITSITMTSGRMYSGGVFIDATYEGDLMATAQVSYHVGREARSTYNEQSNGILVGSILPYDNFGTLKISPYRVPNDPTSGVLARISVAPPGQDGHGDTRIQAYCFRLCLTKRHDNQIPFSKPDNYDPAQYELLLRVLGAGRRGNFRNSKAIPNHKTDTNTIGPFSFDNIGYNWDYPEARYDRRREIIKEHVTYQKGLLYFLANDPRVPSDVQSEARTWGLAKDEFQDNAGWPYQLYIREARRMIGRFVMTENELRKLSPTPESVGMGSYTLDSHHVQRFITAEGYVQNEGLVYGPIQSGPYAIAYGSLTPKQSEADNLLVPIAVSSSHIAYGSIRMEPVFMILGQSAATAAVIALEEKCSVQNVSYAQLRKRLLADGQVLEYTDRAPAMHSVDH